MIDFFIDRLRLSKIERGVCYIIGLAVIAVACYYQQYGTVLMVAAGLAMAGLAALSTIEDRLTREYTERARASSNAGMEYFTRKMKEFTIEVDGRYQAFTNQTVQRVATIADERGRFAGELDSIHHRRAIARAQREAKRTGEPYQEPKREAFDILHSRATIILQHGEPDPRFRDVS